MFSDFDTDMYVGRIEVSTTIPLSCCLVKEMYNINGGDLKDKAFVAMHIENRDQILLLSQKTDK